MSGRVRVWCLRHGESANVIAGIAGAVPTAPLTARGRRQAIAAAQALAGEPLARIYASTALRARQTAELLATAPTVDIAEMPELVEVGIGQHEGTSDPSIRAHTAEVLRAWIIDQDLGRRVADGESGRQVVARVTAAFRQIADLHPGETVAVVGHVASLTVTLGRLCALGTRVWGKPLPHAHPFLVEGDGHAWSCPAWPGAAD
ncbi:alpha-ribazole phosphatase/probable phosphoglycerate mutase [Nonomuraea polychroma]|uniref:Alpha-ribazole phosphatase/probable phosphoglycerate mutase n=1 Tax=Nonomuraea polychroma TaxID=46176 RepID=A0A438MLW1_9ACTN|nr:histidine phosphatase family protein [Nonomuraea polychroma]RVX46744.1 alpha-ribazole phosphatase/probable phosphoglycerate mutase [Nonomuraea polychroma]